MPSRETQFANGHEPTNGGARKSPYQQAVALQKVIYDAATAKRVKPAVLSSLARAWSDLEERKRVLKMKFRPGDLRPGDLHPDKLRQMARRIPRQKLIDLPTMGQAISVELEAGGVKPAAKATTGGTEPEATGPVPPPARKEAFKPRV